MPHTSIEFDQTILGQIDGLAKTKDKSRDWVIQEAIAKYLSYETWFAQQVQEGIDAVKNGKVISHEDAKDRIRNLGIEID
ncbi:toxin-antitoxin system antitoxin subunit [Marinifilum sp. JC120]|nr:toxin-antitoxin system antitoxin subunit [Marinifilum sp. JC120]